MAAVDLCLRPVQDSDLPVFWEQLTDPELQGCLGQPVEPGEPGRTRSARGSPPITTAASASQEQPE